MLFGGTYAHMKYHCHTLDGSKKITTLNQNLAMFFTCYPFAALQTTATPPQCQLSASVAHRLYLVPCQVCIPCVNFVSCRNPTSTFPL